MEAHKDLNKSIKKNTHQIDVMTTDELVFAWEKATGKNYSQDVIGAGEFVAGNAATVLDLKKAAELIKGIGATGKVALKTVYGKQYVIFKGYSQQRSIFKGTRYLASNPKIVDMAIGHKGVKNSVYSGARLTVCLTIPLNILKYILQDEYTMHDLIGRTAMDVAKIWASAALAAGAATMVTGSLAAFAVGPLLVAIIVGVASAYILDTLDTRFGVSDALVQYIEELDESFFGEMRRQWRKVEELLKWQARNGKPVGRGVFY